MAYVHPDRAYQVVHRSTAYTLRTTGDDDAGRADPAISRNLNGPGEGDPVFAPHQIDSVTETLVPVDGSGGGTRGVGRPTAGPNLVEFPEKTVPIHDKRR